MLGMKLSGLSEDILREIFLAYERVVGGNIGRYVFSDTAPSLENRLVYIRKNMNESNVAEFRFGSKLRGDERMNGKLVIWNEGPVPGDSFPGDRIIRFSFDPNLVRGSEAENIAEEFEKEIDTLLVSKNIALSLSLENNPVTDSPPV